MAERFVVGAAVSFLQTVLWAVAGVVFIPLLPAAILRTLETSLLHTRGEKKKKTYVFQFITEPEL